MARLIRPVGTIMSLAGAAGVGTAQNVADYQHVIITVTAAANSSLTFKFSGSTMEAVPNFGAAQAATNLWDYIAVYDMQTDGTVIPGDTGVTINNDTVVNNTRQYRLVSPFMKWVNVEITAWTDGSLSAYVSGANDSER
jgi:hypothetical protein